MIELKPCPFCGGEAEYVYCSNMMLIPTLRQVAVQCKECGVATAVVDASTEYCAKDKATEVWNRRADNDT
jgi:Lar family restriction alleviation protein